MRVYCCRQDTPRKLQRIQTDTKKKIQSEKRRTAYTTQPQSSTWYTLLPCCLNSVKFKTARKTNLLVWKNSFLSQIRVDCRLCRYAISLPHHVIPETIIATTTTAVATTATIIIRCRRCYVLHACVYARAKKMRGQSVNVPENIGSQFAYRYTHTHTTQTHDMN